MSPEALIDRQLEAHFKALAQIADLNAAAVRATVDSFDHGDPEQAGYAPQAVAYAMAQVQRLLLPLMSYASGLEVVHGPNADLLLRQD
jgi:hypothetical protein